MTCVSLFLTKAKLPEALHLLLPVRPAKGSNAPIVRQRKFGRNPSGGSHPLWGNTIGPKKSKEKCVEVAAPAPDCVVGEGGSRSDMPYLFKGISQ